MPTDKEKIIAAWEQSNIVNYANLREERTFLLSRMADIAVEQVRASEWPTEAMIDAAELKMPDLGRLQIRFLFETMVAAACGSAAEQVREREVVPLGWKLVPIEPDDYMKMEGANLLRSIPENSAEYRAGHCYRAMLSATPVISD